MPPASTISGRSFPGRYRWLAALLLLLSAFPVLAACSAWRSPQKAWFNEYFFGSGANAPPNFLELYSTSNAFPAEWQGASVEVYAGEGSKSTYTFTNATATACTVANKTWVTLNVLGGLRQQNALVILRDPAGDTVDAFVFDNTVPPAPWSSATSNWTTGDTTGCPALDAELNLQRANLVANPTLYAKQANMLVLGNYGNKDMARTPDGGPLWDLTSNTGAGTTYTQCITNNANFNKTVDNATPTPGSTVTFTLSLTNTGGSSLSGVKVDDFLPDYPVSGAPTFTSAIPANPADTVTTSTYATIDPNTATPVNATKLTWSLAPVAAGATAKLNIKMQVPANATTGYIYPNTAQTTAGLSPGQSDFANIAIGSPNVGSFVLSVSPATASTCTPALLGPKVTITAMTGPNGSGSVNTGYGGVVYLTASSPNVSWFDGAGNPVNVAPLPGGHFVNGVANFYLKGSEAETVTVAALDVATYAPSLMQGSSGSISFVAESGALLLTDADTLTPTHGAVAGRPHKLRTTITSCGATATGRTGSYGGTLKYTAGLNHPAGAAAPTISTTGTCPGTIGPLSAISTSAVTLAFAAGVSDFYLCTTDVGQYALNLSLVLPSPQGGTYVGNSANLTVRPFAITATGLPSGGTVKAGHEFAGTFDAWLWHAAYDDLAGQIDGNPDSDVTATMFLAANSGKPPRFSGTVNNAGVVSFQPRLVSPSPGTLGTLTPTTATATSATVTLANLTYSEVGSIGLDGNAIGAANYLGMSGLNVPILSMVAERFIPDHFDVEVSNACNAGGFSYSGQPFPLRVTARRLGGATTANYTGAHARAATLTDANGAVGSFTPLSVAATSFTNGVADLTATPSVSFAFTNKQTAPATLKVRVTDTDSVSSATGSEGTTPLRSGRLRLINAYGSELLPARVEYRAEYWAGNRWATNAIDICTTLAAANIASGGLGAANVGAMTNGIGFITFPVAAAGSYDIAVNLNAGGNDTSCNASHGGTAANRPWLQGHWAPPASCGGVAAWAQDPNARIRLGSPRAPYLYLRERY